MNDIAKFLNDEDQLSRLHRYELNRREGYVSIYVFEPISAPADAEYMAIPCRLSGFFAKEPFIGRGASHDEALIDCLSKIKGIPTSVIFPLPSETSV